ncbi:zinc finger and BTB domain-containing protein 49 [Aedes aegypti]|uniref:C2H2-type domain-containing protein n=1 Tax=Aedes aegypti TaxID=7159 RepID=A0A6I8U4X4_AEDAE|nr:zinc finger and BTB domain-containing protein 49 [Aedes aegypti]
MENHNDHQINSDQTNYQIVEYVADGNTQQSVSEAVLQFFPNAAPFEAAGVPQPVPVEIVTFQNESELKAYLDTQSASETTIWPTIFNESELQLFPNASPFEAVESQPNPAECATFQTDSDLKAFLDTLSVEEVLKTFQEHYPSSEWPDSTIPQCVSDFSVAAPEGAATYNPTMEYPPIVGKSESAPCNSIPQKPRMKRKIKKVQTFTSSWNCELCGKAFKSKGGQVQHNQQIHSGPTPHVCNICGKRFRDFDTMETHRQRHLMKDKPFKCSECPKQFIRHSDLQRHIVLHHSVSPHQCDICGKVFDRADHVTDHKWSHTNGTVKKLKARKPF